MLDLAPAYVEAVLGEMALRAWEYPGLRAHTLYFGGGTPSLLPAESVGRLIDAARKEFDLPPSSEVTLEANPGTVDAEGLAQLRAAGVNRLSLGAQSANDEALALLERTHDWQDVVDTVAAARAAGFADLSLDLIFGLPGQSLDRWDETLEAALRLEPEHLSLYALKLEPGTALAARVGRGALAAPDPDLAADMYELASERLVVAGYWQYEISNWARGEAPPPEIWALPPGGVTEAIGPVSRHNLAYWRTEPWLGLGAGATSWLAGRRWTNLAHPQGYAEAVRARGFLEAEEELIGRATAMGEFLMMGLRLAEGVTEARFRERFDAGLEESYGEEIARFVRLGLLQWDGERLRLTARGRLLGNRVFGAFFKD
jgi:oxygen-independent coproporphyrinogen-3 oxidase